MDAKRDEIKSVPARWKAQNTDAAGRWRYPEQEAIYNRLMALDLNTATPDDIAAVIGNRSWVSRRELPGDEEE